MHCHRMLKFPVFCHEFVLAKAANRLSWGCNSDGNLDIILISFLLGEPGTLVHPLSETQLH